jgi:hypothetical protein
MIPDITMLDSNIPIRTKLKNCSPKYKAKNIIPVKIIFSEERGEELRPSIIAK